MAHGVRNASVSCITVEWPRDDAIYSVLALAFPSNSTLRRLDLGRQNYDGDPVMAAFFLAVRKNTGLKTLKVEVCEWMDEPLCAAIKNGLELNETLESLKFVKKNRR
jgi:hypothetical protein